MNRASKSLLCAAAGLSLLSAAGCAAGEDTADAGQAPAESPTASPSTSGTASASGSASESYADGEYSGTGSYIPPSGTSEDVDVTLTLEGGVVTELEVETSQKNPTSKQYQREFTSGVKEQVVGKSLDELDVDKVAGSSLTSEGFNRALDAVRSVAAS
ncbi:FMN-binding protein [Arthrobacter sp. zg-Y877]|uniref:FMN-binding protein n=1 Tax=Arthrobacter sp. zg-Y877 TaxID=3049074 RepID=UPI0025A3FDF9|nr:FMN-binding protein [Arthrobacter sp. zg-Y877]MDM7989735.1 FMN-binding protein [Arthrobacter sp. zg-Y877]